MIEGRIYRLTLGLFGDARPVGAGVIELRIHCGRGYRIYFMRETEAIILLLAGGAKDTQRRDIARAIGLCNVAKRGQL